MALNVCWLIRLYLAGIIMGKLVDLKMVNQLRNSSKMNYGRATYGHNNSIVRAVLKKTSSVTDNVTSFFYMSYIFAI